jgi:hypothetical protein
MNKATYQTDCRGCAKHIRVDFTVDEQFVDEQPAKRIRCGGCKTTNYIPKPDGVV